MMETMWKDLRLFHVVKDVFLKLSNATGGKYRWYRMFVGWGALFLSVTVKASG